MNNVQFSFLCSTFGDSLAPEAERWKCVRYIYVKNPLIDVQSFLKKGEVAYVNNSTIGPGFYIMGKPNNELGVTDNSTVVTFVPLESIKKLILNLDKLDISFGDHIDFTGNEDYLKYMINNQEIDDKRVLTSVYHNEYPTNDFMVILG